MEENEKINDQFAPDLDIVEIHLDEEEYDDLEEMELENS